MLTVPYKASAYFNYINFALISSIIESEDQKPGK